jgi:large subunit ribosomal protein L19
MPVILGELSPARPAGARRRCAPTFISVQAGFIRILIAAIMRQPGENLSGEETGMSDLILQQLEREWIAGRSVPELRPGDVVRVHLRVREGDKERVQIFQGTVIRIRGSGAGRTFTVRRIAAHGIGVERTFPLYSPRIDHIEVIRHSRVRRARLYYLRERFGKAARLKERLIAAPGAAELPPEAPEASEEAGA